MPQDLPGFYFDSEKNRYFPIKGPIPGSSRKSAPVQKPVSELTQVNKIRKKARQINKLLHSRELCGNTISTRNWNGSFQQEYRNYQASQPLVWKYQGTERDCDGALALKCFSIQTPIGEVDTDVLLTGGANGSLSLFDVGRVGQNFDHGVKWPAEYCYPNRLECETHCVPKDIWKLNGASLVLPSNISSISTPRKEAWPLGNHGSTSQSMLVTTLGSESLGGSLYTLNLSEPLDLDATTPAVGHLREVASISCTIWAADCSSNSNNSVIGTNFGAMLVDLETRVSSTLCRSKSDALSVQFIYSGNVVLCGLRNGLIVTFDVRQRQPSLPRHHIPISTPDSTRPSGAGATRSSRCTIRGNIKPNCTVSMTSSISGLTALSLYDQYFLASSMDGLVKLYDHRMIQQGPVQSYEGHVNTHSRIQLGVDPQERFVISGGEDSKTRIWNIKSGEMLFNDKFTNSIPMTVCCQGNGFHSRALASKQNCSEYSWGAWLGATEGLYWMQFT
ncbi:hypothetical protein V2J09_001778 [Rumex salicifolius]